MADVNVPALAIINPVAQRNAAPQSPPQQTDQPEQPSFAQVLKSRTQNADKATSKPADKPQQDSQSRQAASSGSAADAAALAEAQAAGKSLLDPSLLLIASGDAGKEILAGSEREDQTEDASLLLPTDPSLSLGVDPTAAAAALAAATASLAGKTGNRGEAAAPFAEERLQNKTDEVGKSIAADSELSTDRPQTPLSSDERLQQLQANILRPQIDETSEGGDKGSKAGGQATASFSSELALAQSNNQQTTQSIAQASLQGVRNEGPLPRHEVNTPVATRGWADDVGQKLTWISTRDSGRAELVLNPPQMGRVEVSISLNGDQASATFAAANPIAREALQDALPRLREVLAQAGIQLGQANVNAGNSGQAQADSQAARNTGNSRYASNDSATLEPVITAGHASWSRSGSGMVDTFA